MRRSSPKLRILGLMVPAIVLCCALSGCPEDIALSECESGAVEVCVCDDRAVGVRTCGPDQRFGACVCDAVDAGSDTNATDTATADSGPRDTDNDIHIDAITEDVPADAPTDGHDAADDLANDAADASDSANDGHLTDLSDIADLSDVADLPNITDADACPGSLRCDGRVIQCQVDTRWVDVSVCEALCWLGTCQDYPAEYWSHCQESADCEDGRLICGGDYYYPLCQFQASPGLAGDPCFDWPECTEGYVCSADGHCVESAVGDSCEDEDGCDMRSHLYCLDWEQCSLGAHGTACDEGECPDDAQFCVDGTCYEGYPDHPCDSHWDCQEGFYCGPDGCHNGVEGDSCTETDHCRLDFVCGPEGTCHEGQDYDPCENDSSQCARGFECAVDICRYVCDNDFINVPEGEVCDGARLNYSDCTELGYASAGVLSCAEDCLAYDTVNCEGSATIDITAEDPARYFGSLDATDDAYNRPDEECRPNIRPGDMYYWDKLVVDNPGVAPIQVSIDVHFLGDGLLLAYLDSFVIANPADDCVEGNDDYRGSSLSHLEVEIPAMSTLLLVVTTFDAMVVIPQYDVTVTVE